MPASESTDRALPTGRYTDFETPDDGGDLRSLLGERPGGRRPRTTRTTPETPAAAAAPTSSPAPPVPAAAPTPSPPPAQAATKPLTVPAGRMRSSSMHIRSALVEQVVSERETTGRSNGAIIIAALEAAHPHLGTLLPPVGEPTGGGLFAARPTHAPRTIEGPYSPLNVRLFEADFEVLDQLVATYGARSRSHLVDAALGHYFHH